MLIFNSIVEHAQNHIFVYKDQLFKINLVIKNSNRIYCKFINSN